MCPMPPHLGSVGQTGKYLNMKQVQFLGEPLRKIISLPVIGNFCPGQTQLRPAQGSQASLVTDPILPLASCLLSGHALPRASV